MYKCQCLIGIKNRVDEHNEKLPGEWIVKGSEEQPDHVFNNCPRCGAFLRGEWLKEPPDELGLYGCREDFDGEYLLFTARIYLAYGKTRYVSSTLLRERMPLIELPHKWEWWSHKMRMPGED